MTEKIMLTEPQVSLLKSAETFRFVSGPSLASEYKRHPASWYAKQLELLNTKGLLIRGSNDVYSISRSGLMHLNPNDEVYIKRAKSQVYRNRSLKQSSIARYLKLHEIYSAVKDEQKSLQWFAINNISHFEYLPRSGIDAYAVCVFEGKTSRFFISLIEDIQKGFEVSRMLKRLQTYFDSEEWLVTNTSLPTVLYIAESNANIRKVGSSWCNHLRETEMELNIFLTTWDEITSGKEIKWHSVYDYRKTKTLRFLANEASDS